MIEIIPMSSDWVPQIAQIERLCFSDPWSEKSISSELENPLALWLVAVEHDRAAGYVGAQTVLGETDMMNVAVHPDYRRQGIAENLINTLILYLAQQGSKCLTLEVRQSNVAAQKLYDKLGFRQVGKRPRYYQNPREDALILRKEWTV